MTNEIKLKITIDGKEAQATLQLTEEEARELVSTIRRAGEQSRDAGKTTVDAFTSARNVIQGVKESFDVFRVSFISHINAYQEQEAALAKLNTALKQTGQFTAENQQALIDYSNHLQQVTIYGDDQTQTVMAQMLAMGLNIEQTKQATLQAANLATVMETDLKTAARAMADLFQGNAGMINRYIKGLDETIIKSGNLNLILKMLNERIGEQAEAFAQTSVGEMAKFNNAISELKENTGQLIVKSLSPFMDLLKDLINMLNKLNPHLIGIIGLFGSLTTALIVLKTTGLSGVLWSLATWTPAMTTAAFATSGFTGAVTTATASVKAFFASLGPIGWTLMALGLVAGAWVTIKSATDDATSSQNKYFKTFQTTSRSALQHALNMNKQRQEQITFLMIDPLLTPEHKESLEKEIAFLLKQEKQLENELNKLRMLDVKPDVIKDKKGLNEQKINEQKKLENELLIRLKESKEKELEQLKQKYEREKQIAAGNKKLLQMLQEAYRKEELEINIKYDKLELDRELMFWEKVSNARKEKLSKMRQNFAGSVVEKSTSEKPTLEFMEQSTEEIINQNFQMSLMYNSILAIDEGIRQASISTANFAAESASAWAVNALGITKVNSLLQMFIVSLIQAISQALMLRLVTAGLNSILPGSAGAADMALSVFGAASGAVVKKPTIMMVGEGKEPEGVFPLSYLSNLVNKQNQSTIVTDINLKIEPVEFKQSGMDLRAVINEVNKHIKNKR